MNRLRGHFQFQRQPNGSVVFYPWRNHGKGYVFESEEPAARLQSWIYGLKIIAVLVLLAWTISERDDIRSLLGFFCGLFVIYWLKIRTLSKMPRSEVPFPQTVSGRLLPRSISILSRIVLIAALTLMLLVHHYPDFFRKLLHY